jgi:hypothetical protein
MNEGLENGNSIFRPVSFAAQCSEREPVRRAIRQIKLAIRVKTLVLSVSETRASRSHHTGKLGS